MAEKNSIGSTGDYGNPTSWLYTADPDLLSRLEGDELEAAELWVLKPGVKSNTVTLPELIFVRPYSGNDSEKWGRDFWTLWYAMGTMKGRALRYSPFVVIDGMYLRGAYRRASRGVDFGVL